MDIANMEKYVEISESIQVEISELEHFFRGPEDADISIHVLRRKCEGLQVRLARRTSRKRSRSRR